MNDRLVMSLHGIRTRGTWQKDLVPKLSQAVFLPVPLDYGWFGAVKLLLPWSRERQVDWFRDEYTARCREYGVDRASIIAHSFGTYLVARAVQKYELKFDRVIFCGAIVRRDYPWTPIIEHGLVGHVLNDFGRLDVWARVVEWVVSDAGQSGLLGFEDPAGGRVVQREHPEFGHSDYFYHKNYLDRWLPFLGGKDPTERAVVPRPRTNWKVRVTATVVLVLALTAGVWAYRHFSRSGPTPTPDRNTKIDAPGGITETQRVPISTRPAPLSLSGSVVDLKTHEPIPDVTLTIENLKTLGGRTPTARTDAEGRFRFADLDPVDAPEFLRLVARKAGYLEIEDHPGLGPDTLRIELSRENNPGASP